MWAVEGLTHRYPTKVLAEVLPTCPQYCGHCTRMDLVGNSTPQVQKLKFSLKPVDRLDAMIDYLRRNPGVRDVVVSGGDVANMPWRNLESFVMRLLDIDTDPRHPAGDQGADGPAPALAAAGGRRGPGAGRPHRRPPRRQPGDPHPRQPRATRSRRWSPQAAQTALEVGVRDVRNQGVLMRGVNATQARSARPVLRAAGRGEHPAVLLLHVRHDPQLRALAGLGRRGAGAAARDHGLPARATPRRGSSATCRTSGSAGCTRSRSTTGSAASRTGRRTTGPASS